MRKLFDAHCGKINNDWKSIPVNKITLSMGNIIQIQVHKTNYNEFNGELHTRSTVMNACLLTRRKRFNLLVALWYN